MYLAQLSLKAVLLSLIAVASATPTPYLDSHSLQAPSTLNSDPAPKLINIQQRGEHDLPPVSAVMMALAMHSAPSDPGATPTLVPHAVDDSVSSSSSAPRATTLRYTGPGILILPGSSSGASHSPLPTQVPDINSGTAHQESPGNLLNAENRPPSSQIHHFAVVGGVIAGVILFTACFFFLMDPRIWAVCCSARQERRRVTCLQKAREKPLPTWMRPVADLSSPENSSEENKAPALSPYAHVSKDSPRSKFSMISSDYGYSADSDASTFFDTSVPSSPVPNLAYNGLGYLSNPSASPPSHAAGSGHPTQPGTPMDTQQPSTPTRPPRPPTADSPAGIESMYYADVDDPGFYRHPNPIILEPISPVVDGPSPITAARAFPNPPLPSHQPPASNVLDVDALQRQARRRSAPETELPPTSNKRNIRRVGATREAMERAGLRLNNPVVEPDRESKSAGSWVQYSEFQHQHHLQLQQRAVTTPSKKPLMDHKVIGAAY